MGLGEVWVRRWSLGGEDSAICGDLRPWCFSCSGLSSADTVRLVCYFSVPAADPQVSAAAASGGQWTCLSRLFLLLTCNPEVRISGVPRCLGLLCAGRRS